jgi:hypothetical protein
MRLEAARRIISDNVQPEQRDTVDSIANSVNPFIENVTTILNGSVGFDNLEAKLIKLNISTDSESKILGNSDVLTNLNRPPFGAIVVDIRNSENPDFTVSIDNAPFILYRPISNTTIRVDNILNLKPNRKYTISILFL